MCQDESVIEKLKISMQKLTFFVSEYAIIKFSEVPVITFTLSVFLTPCILCGAVSAMTKMFVRPSVHQTRDL